MEFLSCLHAIGGILEMLLENPRMDIFVFLIVSLLAFSYYVLFLKGGAKNVAPPDWPFVGMLPFLFIHFNHLYDSISENYGFNKERRLW